jgi:hypothetical protein
VIICSRYFFVLDFRFLLNYDGFALLLVLGRWLLVHEVEIIITMGDELRFINVIIKVILFGLCYSIIDYVEHAVHSRDLWLEDALRVLVQKVVGVY